MAAAETARLIASLELQDRNFTRGIRNVERGVARVDRKLGAFSGFVNRNMARAIDSIGLRLVSSVGQGLEELATLEDATSSVTGAIAQVGKGWTLTADDIAQAANRIESETDAAFDDKAIVAATETLIRYGKVTENNIEPAMEVMTDLAARTGDVESASTLLAKALADPAKAAGKLARSGVVLTKQQQKQIKAMVEAGDVAGAQTFLLEELAKTTKGAAAASAGPYRDALNKLGDAGEDLRRGFVTGLAPAILEVSTLLTDELAKPATMETLKDVGKEIGGALKGLISVVKSLPWETIGTSLKIAGTGAKAVLDAFLALPPWIQTAVITGWGLNKLTGGALSNIVGSLASGLVKGVLGINAGVVNLKAASVVGGPGVGVGGGKGGGRFGRLGGLGGLLLGGISVTLVGEALALQQQISNNSTEQANTAQQNLNNMLAQDAKLSDMLIAQRATRDGIKDIRSNPLLTVVQGEALDRLVSMDAQLSKAIEEQARPVINKRAPVNAALNQASIAAREGGGKTSAEELKKIQAQATITARAARDAKQIASREASRNDQRFATAAEKQAMTKAAIDNARSIASRENSAQKAEIARAKNAAATAGRNTTNATNKVPPAVRGNAITVASSMAAAASRIVTAVNALDLSVNVTTVNRTSTINNRYGPSGGSSTTNRSGELE